MATETTPASDAPADAPKALTKSQLKKLAKQKNAKPKMSKEEKMKAVSCLVRDSLRSGD